MLQGLNIIIQIHSYAVDTIIIKIINFIFRYLFQVELVRKIIISKTKENSIELIKIAEFKIYNSQDIISTLLNGCSVKCMHAQL